MHTIRKNYRRFMKASTTTNRIFLMTHSRWLLLVLICDSKTFFGATLIQNTIEQQPRIEDKTGTVSNFSTCLSYYKV